MSSPSSVFTRYQIFYIVLAALSQFLIILDFMVLSPLGPQLMPALHITPSQFGLVVSAYAFSAGISGILAAGFADQFDRKHLLLFFYGGFIVGTLLCALATSYWFLLGARIVTGIFGGVVGAIGAAVITDLFAPHLRGRVMGFVQMAFAVSQVLGLPLGLYFSNIWGWHAPFLMIVALAVPLWLVTLWKMKPVREHLDIQSDRSATEHLWHTARNGFYRKSFLATTLLATGGFMLMPFGAAFTVHNLGLSLADLPKIYLVTGICSMVFGPISGKLTDRFGSIPVFWISSLLGIILVLYYTNLSTITLGAMMLLNALLFMGITGRMVSVSTLVSRVPAPADRGAFMSINNSVSQVSGGVASMLAGLIIQEGTDGRLEHYPVLGLVVSATMVLSGWLMWRIDKALTAGGLI